MKLKRVKILAIMLAAVPLLAVGLFSINPVAAGSSSLSVTRDDDTETMFKTKCAMCHKPTAEKFFDPAKMDDALIEIVLKGKKAEKPPNMPSFEEKGITKDQAKLLVGYMRQLRAPAQSPSETPTPKP